MAKRISKTTGYKYLGGASIQGVPARDLTATEYKIHAVTIEREQSAIGFMLYEPIAASAANEEV